MSNSAIGNRPSGIGRQAWRFLTGGTIAGRMLLWFLTIALVPFGIVTFLIYCLSADTIESMVNDTLEVIAKNKDSQLETYAVERTRFITALARSPSLEEACTNMTAALAGSQETNSVRYREMLNKYGPFLTSFTDALGYPDLMLLSPAGMVLYSVHHPALAGVNVTSGDYAGSELAKLVDRARTLLQPDISGFGVYPGLTEPAAYVAGPILKEGAVVGVVAVQISNRELFAIVNDYIGLGRTGEMVVAAREGDEIVMVNPLRHPQSNFKGRFKIGDTKAVALQKAVRGENGRGMVNDYRLEPCFAVWGYLPSYRWGYVVKVDTAEAFDLVLEQGKAVLGLALVTVLVVVLLALVVARSLSKPIRAAAAAAAQIAEGDLTTPVRVHGRTEVGRLLGAIQSMTQSLSALIGRMKAAGGRVCSTAGQISRTSKNQEEMVLGFSASANQIAAAVNELSATGQELAKTMTDVSAVAAGTANLADAGRIGLTDMEAAMGKLTGASGTIAEKLAVIHEKATGINAVITTITKVADQTNLLSINAAIEAEKAGQYGRGFQVVAQEINRLSDQTAVATLDIERMVKDMHQAVSAGVGEMSAFSEVVRSCVESVGQIGGQLGEIIERVEGLNRRFEQVSEGMQHGATAAGQISAAMSQLQEGAQTTRTAIGELHRASAELSDAAEGLQNEVARFKVR